MFPAGGASSSGASCPGLIEAGVSMRSWSIHWLPHPGLLAPASLKLAVGHSAAVGGGGSSGASCPGLIEATTAGGCSVLSRPSSGASCPGLIEAPPVVVPPAAGSHSSGASCPGLIEAGSAATGPGLPQSSSGASCPGLIEARWRPRCQVSTFAHPGLLAPASLKRDKPMTGQDQSILLIRGFLPRPH